MRHVDFILIVRLQAWQSVAASIQLAPLFIFAIIAQSLNTIQIGFKTQAPPGLMMMSLNRAREGRRLAFAEVLSLASPIITPALHG
jgi:hypothetical protein